MLRYCLFMGLCCALWGRTAAAQNPNRTGKSIQASKATSGINVDGKLDDEAWKKAVWAEDFAQRQPVENGTPSRRTELAFLYDDEALYVGARLEMRGKEDVQALLTRRDDSGNAQRIIISFDTFRDRRTAQSFALTAAGVRVDWFHPEDATFPREAEYDPVWWGDVHVSENAWTAEMRIPWTQLRFPEDAQEPWGVNINHYLPQFNEDVFWVVIPQTETGWSSWFGDLKGLEGRDSPLRLEFRPYLAADGTYNSPSIADESPFTDPTDLGARGGLDVKLGIGPGITVDATVNPDFGQVEADPAVVNLTAFEFQFTERRPFFIEGQDVLKGRGDQYYFSRRIGGPSRVSLDFDDVDRPRSTRILGAVKSVGRIGNGFRFGALSALTGDTKVRVLDGDDTTKALIAPLTSYNTLRLQKEFEGDATVAGLTATATARKLGDRPTLAAQLAEQAFTGGGDFDWRFLSNRFQVRGDVGFSYVKGSEEAITALQRNSVHFFQRPDQDHVTVDEDRTHLFGWRSALAVAQLSGNLTWEVASTWISPGFELNDLGFLRTADVGLTTANFKYQEPQAKTLQRWEIGASVEQPTNFDLVRLPTTLGVRGGITLKNFWSITLNPEIYTSAVSDKLTRGGPLMGVAPIWSTQLNVENGFGNRTRFESELQYQVSKTDFTGWRGFASLAFSPTDAMRISLKPTFIWATNTRQYLSTLDGGREQTFGNRYIFGTVKQRELSLQTRLDLPLTPNLSVELYAEPFFSSGEFSDIGELERPRSRDLRVYGESGTTITRVDNGFRVGADGGMFELADPDFTVLSLRSTAVLRWEFTPGSIFFLVWQRNRADRLARQVRLRNSVDDVFGAPGSQTVAMKFTYFWPL